MRRAGCSAVPAPGSTPDAVNRFRRSEADKWIGGVCGGLGRSTGIESWAWRLLYCAAAVRRRRRRGVRPPVDTSCRASEFGSPTATSQHVQIIRRRRDRRRPGRLHRCHSRGATRPEHSVHRRLEERERRPRAGRDLHSTSAASRARRCCSRATTYDLAGQHFADHGIRSTASASIWRRCSAQGQAS